MTKDITPFVRAWLEEPVELPETPGIAKIAELVHDTRQQHGRSPFSAIGSRLRQSSIQAASDPLSTVIATTRSMVSATQFFMSALVVVFVAGLLFIAQPLDRVVAPGAETERLAPVTGPAGNGLIAFARDGDIYVGDPATGESEAIVAGPEYDAEPAFSPDGSRLAFTRFEEDPRDLVGPWPWHSASLVAVRPDGSDGRVVGPVNMGFLWAPDGRLLSYEEPSRGGALTFFDATGVAPTRTVTLPTLDLPVPPFREMGHVAAFMRPPLGDRILDWDGTMYLDVVDADGSSAQRLIDETRLRDHAFGNVYLPAWSPDGSMIAFVTDAGEQSRIIVMDSDGENLRDIGEGWEAHWSPDGARIKSTRYPECAAAEECGARLIIIDVATGTEREFEVIDLGGSSWSPDGMSIIYTSGEQGRVYTVDVETGDVTELPWETENQGPGPSWQRVAVD